MDYLTEYVVVPLCIIGALFAGWHLKIWWIAGPLVAVAVYMLFDTAEIRWLTASAYGLLAAFATRVRAQESR